MKGNVTQIEPGIFLIDHDFLGIPGVIGSYLLAGEDDLTLIESGPTTTLDTVLAGIRAAGFQPEQITKVAVTHIHLDHAGSAGVLLEQAPNARLLVHEAGAPHMIDPSRLIASATRIWEEDMDRLWGEMRPVPEERIDILADGDIFDAGGRRLTALATPGHASHHFAYHDDVNGLVFTGDVAGVRLSNAPYVRPPTVAPELSLELWRESIARLRALRPRRLCLTHYGTCDDPDWHFDDLITRLFFWSGWAEARLAAEPEAGRVVSELQERGNAEIIEATGNPALIDPYEVAVSYEMIIAGMSRYFRKRRG